ncbi:HIT zinc finger domain-containing protein [Phthorimaea operculella]|nr:HIT zinc finger domain-containing protein [Phthorimaea operculella]
MSAQSPSSSSAKICELCNENASKYCCPRCEVLYCSLDCYKSEKHMSCSETFYRDCVNEELAALNTDDESKQKMIDILKKMREGDDGFGKFDLEERIQGLDLGDADAIWNVLTEDERNEFEALVSQGDVGSIVPQWEPWWAYSKDARLVRDIDDKEEEEALKKCPKMVDVPEFRTITNIQPSLTIHYNITNLLASYAFVMRYFNGELEPIEGTTCLLNVCATLDTNTNFEEVAMAVESVKQKCLQSDLIETDEASLEIMKRDTFSSFRVPVKKTNFIIAEQLYQISIHCCLERDLH